jgi:hypothetical protein
VQVKTKSKTASFWLVNRHVTTMTSDSHVYVFVNLRGEGRPEYLVVPSERVADKVIPGTSSTGSVWYPFYRKDRVSEGEGWELFGSAVA